MVVTYQLFFVRFDLKGLDPNTAEDVKGIKAAAEKSKLLQH